MRRPVDPLAVRHVDLANALYALMLRLLSLTYAMESRPWDARKALSEGAFALMGALAKAETVATLPVSPHAPGVNAGVSFALNRHTGPLELSSEKRLLLERTEEVRRAAEQIREGGERGDGLRNLEAICATLSHVVQSLGAAELGGDDAPL